MKQKFLEILGELDKTETISEDSTHLFENSSRYKQKHRGPEIIKPSLMYIGQVTRYFCNSHSFHIKC